MKNYFYLSAIRYKFIFPYQIHRSNNKTSFFMSSYSNFYDPAPGQTVRKDCTSGFCAGTVSGAYSSILGGPLSIIGGTNTNSADYSTIVMGQKNAINLA